MIQTLDQQKIAYTMLLIWPDCFGADNSLTCKVELLEATILNSKHIVSASLLRSDNVKRKLTQKEAAQLGYDVVEVLS